MRSDCVHPRRDRWCRLEPQEVECRLANVAESGVQCSHADPVETSMRQKDEQEEHEVNAEGLVHREGVVPQTYGVAGEGHPHNAPGQDEDVVDREGAREDGHGLAEPQTNHS
jgi:hypothetical protein